ncbi:MAG: hypothetical protein PHQ27_09430, partial [Victivallales bacterium]|nr:hypothetical protein [Victivallales bacterium]
MTINHAILPLGLSLLCSMAPILQAGADQPTSTRPRTITVTDRRQAEKDYKLLPLGVMDYDTVDKTCRPWLSPGWLLVNEKIRDSVLVYDTPAVIKKISNFLREADLNAPNIRLEFNY